MTTPDILDTVGFKKSKIGHGDKEIGYEINESSLCSLLGGTVLCFAIMGFMVVTMVYDIHLEKKTFHKELRQEEHHAASKLAQVQMELWSQYRADVAESTEASQLMKHLEASYGTFTGQFQGAVGQYAAELNLNQEKAAKFADKLLHLVADMQQDNIKHAKHLLAHLIVSGKKGHTLEEHVEKEIQKEVREEEQHVKDDIAAGMPVAYVAPEDKQESGDAEEDPLKTTLEGIWFIFNDYEREFGGKVRENFKKKNAVYDQLVELEAKITGKNPPDEAAIAEALDKVDLVSAGASLGAGRVLPVEDIVEELVLIPKIPHQELAALEKSWRKGEQDSVTVFSKLQELHRQGELPSGWLQVGVDRQEKEEEAEDESGRGT